MRLGLDLMPGVTDYGYNSVAIHHGNSMLMRFVAVIYNWCKLLSNKLHLVYLVHVVVSNNTVHLKNSLHSLASISVLLLLLLWHRNSLLADE